MLHVHCSINYLLSSDRWVFHIPERMIAKQIFQQNNSKSLLPNLSICCIVRSMDKLNCLSLRNVATRHAYLLHCEKTFAKAGLAHFYEIFAEQSSMKVSEWPTNHTKAEELHYHMMMSDDFFHKFWKISELTRVPFFFLTYTENTG